jgi:MFS family permease
VLALATVSWIGLGPRPPQGESERPNWHSLTSGYRFILVQPIILGAMTLDLVAVLLGGVTALLPIYVGQIFLVGPWALGLLRTAPAIGAIVMGLVLTWRPLQRHVGRSLMIAVAVYGVATIGFGLSTSLPVAIVFLAILGAADTVSQVIRGSLVQLATPDHMRGRVSAVYSMITGTSNELGEFESGMLAAAVGAVPAVVLGGVAAIGAAIAWQWLFPTLASADHLEQPPEDAEPAGA